MGEAFAIRRLRSGKTYRSPLSVVAYTQRLYLVEATIL